MVGETQEVPTRDEGELVRIFFQRRGPTSLDQSKPDLAGRSYDIRTQTKTAVLENRVPRSNMPVGTAPSLITEQRYRKGVRANGGKRGYLVKRENMIFWGRRANRTGKVKGCASHTPRA